MAVSLSQDIILLQIITRVPTKSAVCFRCVSKQWNLFLMSDMFKEMHNNILKDYEYPYLEDRKLFILSRGAATFYSINCESPLHNARCSRPLPQFVARSPQYTRILTSFHGLVCLGILKKILEDYDIILWNPVTSEYKRLSKPSNPDHMECINCYGRGYAYGLYYCSGEDDYKLVVVTKSGNAYIYSLKSDSWRKLDTKPPFRRYFWRRPGFCLNKNLYFLSNTITAGSMRFDTKAKSFHKINIPTLFPHEGGTSITVQKGSIHYCAMYNYMIELWKYIADEDIWSKVVTYQLLPNYDISGLCRLHLMSNGNMFMIDYRGGGNHICQVDLIKKKFTKDKKDGHKKGKIKSKGNYHDEYKLLYYSDFTMDQPEGAIIYTETFVSPNRYMK